MTQRPVTTGLETPYITSCHWSYMGDNQGPENLSSCLYKCIQVIMFMKTIQ